MRCRVGSFLRKKRKLCGELPVFFLRKGGDSAQSYPVFFKEEKGEETLRRVFSFLTEELVTLRRVPPPFGRKLAIVDARFLLFLWQRVNNR